MIEFAARSLDKTWNMRRSRNADLFDQATPVTIRPFLSGHTVSTAAHEGWDKFQNGDLLDTAKAAGFDVFLTTDKNIRYQQNLTGRKGHLQTRLTVARAPGHQLSICSTTFASTL